MSFTIEETSFESLNAIEITTPLAQMVLVTECGPRIAFFGRPNGENILYWDKDAVQSGEWKLHGGHRVWITRPYADESVDAYMGDNDPCTITITGNTITAQSPPHPTFQISRGMSIECLSDDTFAVTNFITNHGAMIYSGGVWSPTCINPEGKVITVDLGRDNATWDAVHLVIPTKFAGNTVLINDPQVTFTEEQMIIVPAGRLTKRCVRAPKGRISMQWEKENLLFTKQSEFSSYGRYPLDGCNIAAFVGADNWMAEMETFGVEQPVEPGATIHNKEIWELRQLKG